MPINTGYIKKALNVAKRGFLVNVIPGILQGMLVQFLYNGKASGDISARKIYKMVQEDDDLWKYMEQAEIERTKILANEALGLDISWLTAEWAINAISSDYPDIASYLLSDSAAQKWLGKQLVGFKKKLGLV